MAEAFKCDRCGERFDGSPVTKVKGSEIDLHVAGSWNSSVWQRRTNRHADGDKADLCLTCIHQVVNEAKASDDRKALAT